MIAEHATRKALVARLDSVAAAWRYWVGSLADAGIGDPHREKIDGLVVQLRATLDQLRCTLIEAGEPVDVPTQEDPASDPSGGPPEQALGPPDTLPAYS